MIRYFPPNGTAGLARSRVRGDSRVPLPPRAQCPTPAGVSFLVHPRQIVVQAFESEPSSPPEIAPRNSIKAPLDAFAKNRSNTKMLNFQKNLSPVHPKKNDPKDQDHSETIRHRQKS